MKSILVTRATFKLGEHQIFGEAVLGRAESTKSFSPNQITSGSGTANTSLPNTTTVPSPFRNLRYPSTGAGYSVVLIYFAQTSMLELRDVKGFLSWVGIFNFNATSGTVSAVLTQKRRDMSRSSGLSSSSVMFRGSSAIPQIGQLPGVSRTTSGCIGQVHSDRVERRFPTVV